MLPDRAYLDRRFGKRGWSRGLLLNYSIGQGEILATPVQLCALAARFANGGKRDPSAHREGDRRSRRKGRLHGEGAARCRSPEIDQRALEIIREAMRGVVANERGTGRAAAIPGIAVAGKTGTAQNPHGEDHAIFVAYAPAEDPAICIAIVMENAGHGGSMAAPIARQVFSAFFNPLGGPGPVASRASERGEIAPWERDTFMISTG